MSQTLKKSIKLPTPVEWELNYVLVFSAVPGLLIDFFYPLKFPLAPHLGGEVNFF